MQNPPISVSPVGIVDTGAQRVAWVTNQGKEDLMPTGITYRRDGVNQAQIPSRLENQTSDATGEENCVLHGGKLRVPMGISM